MTVGHTMTASTALA